MVITVSRDNDPQEVLNIASSNRDVYDALQSNQVVQLALNLTTTYCICKKGFYSLKVLGGVGGECGLRMLKLVAVVGCSLGVKDEMVETLLE